jgi:hypothetical protein
MFHEESKAGFLAKERICKANRQSYQAVTSLEIQTPLM